jgi:hypothetical protein
VLAPDALGEFLRQAHDREDEVWYENLLPERRVAEDVLRLCVELGDDVARLAFGR